MPSDANDATGLDQRFAALARLACVIPGVSGVLILRGSAGSWLELAQAGDVGAVRKAWSRSAQTGDTSTADVPDILTLPFAAAGENVGGMLFVHGEITDPTALELVAAQASALLELGDAEGDKASAERRQRFTSRLASRLRLSRTPERVVSAALEEVRAELGAESVSFGLLGETGGVTVETTHSGGGVPGHRRMPLAAFGLDARHRDLGQPVTFPTAASATVPLATDGRLSALLHLQAAEGRAWTGRDLGLAAEAADIFWREHARAVFESELSSGESRLNTVLASVSDGFYALDAEWRFTVFNRAAERFFGIQFGRVAGRSLRDVFPEVVRSNLEAHLAHVMATGVPAAIEMRSAARPDRTLEIRASPQAGGGVAVTFTDVTDRLVRLDELHGIEERMAALLGQARAGICETSLDGRFLSVNPRFCEIVGRSETELLHLDQASITISDDVSASLDLCRRMISTGEGFTIEKRYARPSGDTVEVANAVGLLNGRGGTTALAIVVARD